MFSEKEKEEIISYVSEASEESKIYLGCDSKKFKKHGEWYAKYTTVIAVHINGKNGAKVFGYHETERDYEKNVKNPVWRLVKESQKVCELFLEFNEHGVFDNHDVEVHLDLNPNKKWASQKAVSQSVGYVKGMTGIDAVIKPDAWVASYAADHMVRFGDFKSSSRATVH